MAYSLACNRSELFSAIGIMSGTMLEEECTLERSVPIIVFHGIEDGVLPYDGSIWYQSIDEVIGFWLGQNEISDNSLISTQLNGGNVLLDQYADDNSCISLYTINEEYDKPGDHVWFSDEIEGVTPNRIMWNFFIDNCGRASSINESENEVVKMFPNPNNGQLTITGAFGLEYEIFDLSGDIILTGEFGTRNQSINLEGFSNGFYLIRVAELVYKCLKI